MTGLNLFQVRDYVVRPALTHIGAWSKAAELLVMGTGLTESGLQYLDQVESNKGDLRAGPAYGLFQMEGFTHDDIWENFIRKKPPLHHKLCDLMSPSPDPIHQLHGNMFYAAAMCRIFYLRIKAPLPAADDLAGMAAYWKRYYNTVHGKGKPEEFIRKAESILKL